MTQSRLRSLLINIMLCWIFGDVTVAFGVPAQYLNLRTTKFEFKSNSGRGDDKKKIATLVFIFVSPFKEISYQYPVSFWYQHFWLFLKVNERITISKNIITLNSADYKLTPSFSPDLPCWKKVRKKYLCLKSHISMFELEDQMGWSIILKICGQRPHFGCW